MLKKVKRTIEEQDADASHELQRQEAALLDLLRHQVDRAVA